MLPLVEAMETCTLERRYRRAVLELCLCQSSLDCYNGRWRLTLEDASQLYDLMNINISKQIMWLSVAVQVIKVERQPRKSRNMNASTFGKRHVVPFSCFNFLNLLECRTKERLNTRGSKCSPRLSVRHCKQPPSLLHPMSSPSSSNSVANKSVFRVNVYYSKPND